MSSGLRTIAAVSPIPLRAMKSGAALAFKVPQWSVQFSQD
jgi:hypothetical protein